MIASLPMYDRPQTAAANDAFWAAIRQAFGSGPERLNRTKANWDVWQDPGLLLSQTCGLPFRTRLHSTVQLVGTPDYGLQGALPGFYYSVFVVRANDKNDLTSYANRTFAYNDPLSQSGWAAPQTHIRDLGFSFGRLICSGGHRNSARAVAEGHADIAALDAVTWRLIRQFDEFSEGLKVIGRTKATPGLPLITARKNDAQGLRAAAQLAIDRLEPPDRQTLGLRGIADIPRAEYLRVPTPPAP